MAPEKNKQPVPGFGRFLTPFLLFTLGLMAFLWLTNLSSGGVELSATKFRRHLLNGEIEKIVRRGDRVECTLGGPGVARTETGRKYKKFYTVIPEEEWARYYQPLVQQAEDEHKLKEYINRPPSKMPDILLNIGIFALGILLIWFLFFRRLSGGPAGGISLFGKSRAQLIQKGQIDVTFDDVAGIDEAKEEVQEIIHFLKDPQRFRRLGGRIPHGVLLIGPPGTGKTLLAKAIAGEAEVPFFSISGSDFVELFVGVGASRVRDLFSQAKANAPCIIFLDEIDAVGRRRGPAVSSGGTEEREQTLNAILVEMQGLSSSENVIVIAATNRPDMLDPALLRPGRFDRRVFVDLPDVKGREEILRIHARKGDIKLRDPADLKVIARSTPTFSGAELENLLNEAALIAVRKDKDAVELEDLEEARDKVRFGRELKSRSVPPVDRRRTAYHEAGHALVTGFLPEIDPLHKVSIIPRGRALGATLMLPRSDEFMLSRKKVLGMITSLLAGRISEEIFLGDVSTGAQNDIERATELARRMVCEWGMSERVGPVHIGSSESHPILDGLPGRRDISEQLARLVDEEVAGIIRSCSERCRAIIEENLDILSAIAERLIEKESLSGEEINEIVRREAERRGREIPDFNVSSRTDEEDGD